MITAEPIARNNTLSDTLNEYLAIRQIDKKKYYPSYLICAKQTWKEIFSGTLYVMSSVWKTVKAGDPYPYVDVPRDAERIFCIGVTDHCGDIKPVYYNNRMNIIPKPVEKKCGCESCQCGGMCESVNSTVLTTNLLFTINGVNYYEKIWIKYCPNGDMIEYKEVPTKKYLDFTGDAGDFNNDFNNDYSIGSGSFSNFEIVVNTFQRKICTLKTQPCGCPVESPDNEKLLLDTCGCFLPFFGHHRKHHCDNFLADSNTEEYGAVKISECGTRIYFRPGRRHHRCNDGRERKIPDFLLVIYQTGGESKNISEQVQVPDNHAVKNAMWSGIDYYSKKFNNKYSRGEKQDAKYIYNDSVNELISYLSPLNMEELADAQDNPIKW
jgi:hypothetical protein